MTHEIAAVSREEILASVAEQYQIEPDYPWARYPNYAVLRHRHNRKWFALLMDVTEDKLGLAGDRRVDVINLKCDPILIGSLLNEPGVFPAYHMSKEYWITVMLDGTHPKESVYRLLDLSYDLTK